MKKSHVDVIYDRKKKVAKTGKGLVELRIYLNHKERKHISLAEIRPDEWEDFKSQPSVQAEILRYQSIIEAMLALGTPLTIENFNKSIGKDSSKKMKEDLTTSSL